MATDTAPKQTDAKPVDSSKDTTAKSATPAKAATAAESATPTSAQANVLQGGQQFVAGVIDAQEKSVTAIVDYQTRTAELSQIPGVATVAQVQAKVLRSVTHTYASAARALLK